MKQRTTLVLFIIALVVGGLAALDYYKGTSTQQAKTNRKRLLDFQSKDVTSVKIELTNRVVTLEKTGELWRVKQPIDVRANANEVNSILDDLQFAERNRTITANELKEMHLADFGLDKPRASVTLQTKKGPLEMLVGSETPTKDALYVRVQGQKDVLVAPKSVYEWLNTKLDDLRDRVVVDFLPASATRLEIRSADRVVELAKTAATPNSESQWMLTRPLAVRADPRKASELLADLSDLRVLDFVSEDPKDLHTYQLDEQERDVTVWTGETSTTLLLGRPLTNDATKVYAKLKDADSIFTISAATAQKFAVQANDLRDAHVLHFADDAVREIDVIHGTEKISLVHTAATWTITAPTTAPAEDSQVNALLRHLTDLTATQFVADVATDLDKYGLVAPTVTINLLGTGTNTLAQLLVGATDTSNAVRFVKRGDEPFVYGVATNIDEWLPRNYLSLRSRHLADLKADQITRLTIEKKSGKTVVERGADKKWQLVEPAQGVLDNDALQQVLDGFAQFRVEEILREGRENLPEYGLDQPEATITASVGDKEYTLAIGKLKGAEDRYALWNEPPLVITILSSQANTLIKDIATSPATATPTPGEAPRASAPTNSPPQGTETVAPAITTTPSTNTPPPSASPELKP
jgi:hypothetical protein